MRTWRTSAGRPWWPRSGACEPVSVRIATAAARCASGSTAGISAALGPGAYYDTPGEALEAFHAAQGATGE